MPTLIAKQITFLMLKTKYKIKSVHRIITLLDKNNSCLSLNVIELTNKTNYLS